MLERLVAICNFSWRIDYSGFKNLQEWNWRNTERKAVNRWLFEAKTALNMPCQDKGMPSRVARGDRKLGANGCWGTTWREERLVASLTATPRSAVRSEAERIPVFWTSSTRPHSPTTVWYADFKVYPCTTVITVVSHMTLFFLLYSKVIRSELTLVVLSGRAVSKNSCIRGRCLFEEGGLRELVQLVIRGECLTEDNSIADDCPFALVPQKSELHCVLLFIS